MSKKWTKEQIMFMKEIIKNKGCGDYYKQCLSDLHCPFVEKGHCNLYYKGGVPSFEFFNDSYKSYLQELLQQHEHDADYGYITCNIKAIGPTQEQIKDAERLVTCKQTTPPHIGTTRVLDYVLGDLKSRAEMGKQKYGHYLETDNGRNALQDAYEEALDMCMYLKQKLLGDEGK